MHFHQKVFTYQKHVTVLKSTVGINLSGVAYLGALIMARRGTEATAPGEVSTLDHGLGLISRVNIYIYS